MKEQYLVFRDRETGDELAAYTIRGTFPGERAATIELLAGERGIAPERITAEIERREAGKTAQGHRVSDPDPIITELRGALYDSHIYLTEYELRDLARKVKRQRAEEPTTLTVYTELLQDLADYSAAVDEGTITDAEFVELQQLEGRIIRGYKGNRYTRPEYQALITIYQRVKDGARVVLRLDQTAPGSDPGEDHPETGA